MKEILAILSIVFAKQKTHKKQKKKKNESNVRAKNTPDETAEDDKGADKDGDTDKQQGTEREIERERGGGRDNVDDDLNNFVYNSLKVKCQIVYLSISPISGYILANICIFAL